MERNERKNKCIYCDDDKEATHFICVDCGCGMCDECYNNYTEHQEHCFDFQESLEDKDFYDYIVEKTGQTDGYMCFKCIEERRNELDRLKDKKITSTRQYFKLNNRVFEVEIDNNLNEDEAINEAYNQISEQIEKNNETIENIFFEELEMCEHKSIVVRLNELDDKTIDDLKNYLLSHDISFDIDERGN